MNIKNYIDSKSLVKIFSIDDNKKILKNLRLESYDLIKSLDEYKKNVFSDGELLVIIMNYSNLNDGSIFENISGINNIMLLVNNNTEFTESDLKYKNILIGYGYKYFGLSEDNKADVFIYDISEYKDEPDWLNSDNWANPELWEK